MLPHMNRGLKYKVVLKYNSIWKILNHEVLEMILKLHV